MPLGNPMPTTLRLPSANKPPRQEVVFDSKLSALCTKPQCLANELQDNKLSHLSWQHTCAHRGAVPHCEAPGTTEMWPLKTEEALRVHQLFRQKRYKVYMVFDFHRFTFSSLSTEQNKRWLLRWEEAGLEPAELGTGPPRPADGHRSLCSALSQSWCGWVTQLTFTLPARKATPHTFLMETCQGFSSSASEL